MSHGLCPNCGRVSQWSFKNYSLSLPPTGGDYEWVETDAQTTCPHCQHNFQVRIRVDLDNQQYITLINSPFPTDVAWHCYVVADVKVWGENDVSITIRHIADHLATAETELAARGGAYQGWHDWRNVLRLSGAGYEKLDGTRLPDSAKNFLKYA